MTLENCLSDSREDPALRMSVWSIPSKTDGLRGQCWRDDANWVAVTVAVVVNDEQE